MGRYFHCKMLEPEKVGDYLIVDASSRNTKIYKEFCAENKLPFAMLKGEQEDVDRWCDTMLSNFDFYEMIQDKANKYEEPNVKNIGEHNGGALWKGKADIVHKDYVIDLKTCGDITKFHNSIYNYNYDSQGYIYRELFGKPILFLVKKKPRTLNLITSTRWYKKKRTHYILEVPLEYNNIHDYNYCVVQTIKLMEQKSIIKN